MKKWFVIVFLWFFQSSFGQSIVSPFNGKSLQTDSLMDYNYIVSGHFHGSGTNKTGYPTNTLLAKIDELNANDNSFVVCLGDLFLDVKNDIPFFEESFFSKLRVPLFNTVGNHDLSDNVYQEHFGATNFQFKTKDDLHLFFDTESDNGSFSKAQIETLKNSIAEFERHKFKRVFIYCHRTIWAKHYEAMNGLFGDNTQSLLGNNFTNEVYPLITELSEKAPVFWFSGSLGDAPASFFYHEDESEDITYIATAIRGLKRDAWLKVMINNESLTFNLISLTGQELLPLESYNAEYWKSKRGRPPFNYRLIPYYIKQNVFNRAFWYGAGSIMILIILFFFFRKRRQSRRSSQ